MKSALILLQGCSQKFTWKNYFHASQFSNLIWSSLSLPKSRKLIDYWRSHLVVNGIVLPGEGVCHNFSQVLGDIGSMRLQARAWTFSCRALWRKGCMPKATGMWLQARALTLDFFPAELSRHRTVCSKQQVCNGQCPLPGEIKLDLHAGAHYSSQPWTIWADLSYLLLICPFRFLAF